MKCEKYTLINVSTEPRKNDSNNFENFCMVQEDFLVNNNSCNKENENTLSFDDLESNNGLNVFSNNSNCEKSDFLKGKLLLTITDKK